MVYFFVETFPNANPMKIIPSPSLPNLKVQRLNVLNKLSTMKGSCIGINSSDGGTEQNAAAAAAAESSSSEHLERRTIDSKHISTVSSLVATKSEDDICKSSKAKESQRNNFGLYALKFHRNLSTHANSMIQSFKKVDIGKRSKSTASKTVRETNISESPEFNSARAHRSKHEQFEPCRQQQIQYHHRADDHHYDGEFDDTNNIDWNDSNRFQRNRFKNDPDNDVNAQANRAPVRPRRIKPIAPKANSKFGSNANATRNSFQSIDLRYSSFDDTTHSMDNFGSDDHNVMNIWNTNYRTNHRCSRSIRMNHDNWTSLPENIQVISHRNTNKIFEFTLLKYSNDSSTCKSNRLKYG